MKAIKFALAALVLIAFGVACTAPAERTAPADNPVAQSAPDSEAAEPAKAKPKGIGEGTFIVGEDIKPGTYKTGGPGDDSLGMCYWARLKGTSGELDDIIANGNPQGPTTITIKASDKAFETNGCKPWVKR